jgi:plastocyanin
VKRLTLSLGLLALAAVLAACSGASAAPGTGQPSAAPASVDPNAPAAPVVTARDMKFLETEVTVPAGQPFELVFDNQEAPPHNVAISDASGAKLFAGEIVSNQKVTYQVPALAAGSYPFICEVHPDMKGTIVAE